MEDEKIKPMRVPLCSTTLLLMVLMVPGLVDCVLCPTGCKCENELLRTNCSQAGIEFVPIQLNPELHSMDLSYNKIVHLHYTFSFYDKLRSLNLSSNRIKNLGSGNFRSQKLLNVLNLSDNHIQTLNKDAFEGMKACTHLDLSNNKLDNIALTAFKDLHSLVVLKLNGNQLDYFEEGLFNFTRNLQDLYLEDNNFLDIPPALNDLTKLRHLALSRNLIEVIEDGKVPNMPLLQSLQLINNIIVEIQQSAFSGLLKLEHLDLSDNNLTAVPTAPLAKLSSLTKLRLSGNSIETVPPVVFRGLFHLKHLTLNRMKYLHQVESRAFVDNINLERISMDYNIRISKLPTRLFHGNTKLKHVSVRYNSITALEATHFPIDQLEELRLGGNPLHCNCSMGWLWQLLQENENKNKTPQVIKPTTDTLWSSNDLILDVSDIVCSGPEDMKGHKLVEASRSQMDCSIGWITIASVVCTVLFIIAIVGGVVIWVPKRKQNEKKSKELAKFRNTNERMTPRKAPIYEVAQIERYMVPQNVVLPNHAMPPYWDPYSQHCNGTMNIYEQISKHENRDRPHIVYV